MEVKIGDFGLATKLEFDGERKRTICGTPNYIAPEVLEGKQGHSYEVDVWSLGVIIYTLIIGKPPFETQEVKLTYRKIRTNDYTKIPDFVSPEANDLITNILKNDPARRLTLDEILDHGWLNGSGTVPKLLPASTQACPPSNTFKALYEGPKVSTENAVGGATKAKAQTAAAGGSRDKDRGALADGAKGADGTTERKELEEVEEAEVWVKKWVDYSSKYGLGYYLSNEAAGVYFNDSTKMVLDPNGHHLDYIERRSSDNQDIEPKGYTLTDHPKELLKKVTLLKHF